MKGKTRTLSEKALQNRIAQLGCIACLHDGVFNDQVSIHHIDGRTKPNAHTKVLPLCAGHHQDGTGHAGLVAVHPWKTRFEKQYGNQYDLLDEVMKRINDQ